jgi:secretion/DNA translocation related TadE-like protein
MFGRPDRGGASIWVLAAGLVLALAGAAGAAVGASVIASHRAGAAADLGAFAGATRMVRGDRAACTHAERIVVANGGRLVDCRVDGLDVIVTVEVDATGLPWRRVATAVARAGPVRG